MWYLLDCPLKTFVLHFENYFLLTDIWFPSCHAILFFLLYTLHWSQVSNIIFLKLIKFLIAPFNLFSMYPTINPYGEFVVIDVMSFKLRRRPYEVGDVIITVSPKDPHKSKFPFIKHHYHSIDIFQSFLLYLIQHYARG